MFGGVVVGHRRVAEKWGEHGESMGRQNHITWTRVIFLGREGGLGNNGGEFIID